MLCKFVLVPEPFLLCIVRSPVQAVEPFLLCSRSTRLGRRMRARPGPRSGLEVGIPN